MSLPLTGSTQYIFRELAWAVTRFGRKKGEGIALGLRLLLGSQWLWCGVVGGVPEEEEEEEDGRGRVR